MTHKPVQFLSPEGETTNSCEKVGPLKEPNKENISPDREIAKFSWRTAKLFGKNIHIL